VKNPLLIVSFITCLLIGTNSFATSLKEDKNNKEGNQESQQTGEKSDLAEVDSAQIDLDSEIPEQPKGLLNKQIKPEEKRPTGELSVPPEDQNNSPVSSFNFLFYLIEKFKFPDLLDESF
jgi:hypothetical protein